MFIPTVIKLLSPKIVKGIIKYVFEENELDLQMKATIEQVAKLTEEVNQLKKEKNG
jgi:hypothetical protein